MPFNCSRCQRQLSDSSDPAEPPLFCMYCGYRLRNPAASDVVLIDAHATRSVVSVTDAEEEPELPVNTSPSSIAGYRLVRHLGAGGMGTVYEAEATASGQRVALKLLAGKLAANPASVERFRQEGRLASQISHPRCVFVLRADTDSGRPFIVMELMPGRTLKDLVEDEGPMPPDTAILRVLDAIEGLIEAHRLGVIHRDVKPSNCFLTEDDRVKIGDFGLSKSLAGNPADQQLTHSGTFLGTVLFAPPEQIRGEPVGYDSDVYSVCATLYYLLSGRAPHQHDSLTAALAKAISEPPPPLRKTCPKVSAELERIVLKGLERDRERRWGSLEELREELQAQLPGYQVPARPRGLLLAYLMDFCVVQILVVVMEFVRFQAVGPPSGPPKAWEISWPQFVISLVYWGLMEGLAGRTLGKRLCRLRVCRLNDTGPPGIARGLLRALVFHSIWLLMIDLPGLAALRLHGLALLGYTLGTWVLGVFLFIRQWRRSAYGFRGFHDFAAGTRVVERPRPPARIKLVSKFPNPLDRTMRTAVKLSETVGGFVIRGKVCETADGGEVWVGEDPTLGRRVVVHVEPPGVGEDAEFDEPIVRPTRLRAVGHGALEWSGGERAWVASVAPAGQPLLDVVASQGLLGWAETRPLLEQLAAELVESAADGTMPPSLVPEQLWVEAGGRVQLLDYPMATGRELAAGEKKSRAALGAPEPLRLLKQVASMMLEGQPRAKGGRLKAPIPCHAAAITNRLFDDADGYAGPDELLSDLAANRTHPPKTTSRLRAGHLTLQAGLLGFGLLVMTAVAGLQSFAVTIVDEEQVRTAYEHCTMLESAANRAELLARARAELPKGGFPREVLERDLDPIRWATVERNLSQLEPRLRGEAVKSRDHLNRLERLLLSRIARYRDVSPIQASEANMLSMAVTLSEADTGRFAQPRNEGPSFGVLTAVIVSWPFAIWPAFAFVFRGGLAFVLSGLALVRTDGRLAERWRCALRELVVWLPLVAVLLSEAYLQWAMPEQVFARSLLGVIGLALIPLYAAVALRNPARGPHDQIAGTFVVPR